MAKEFLVQLASDVKKLKVAQQNMMKIGTITEVDYATNKARACVHMDTERGLTTPLVRWLSSSGGNSTEYSAPKVGDTVVVLAQGGDLSQAIILPWLYKGDQSTPGTGEDPYPNPGDVYQKEFSDGSSWKVFTDIKETVLGLAAGGLLKILSPTKADTAIEVNDAGEVNIGADETISIRRGNTMIRVDSTGVEVNSTDAVLVQGTNIAIFGTDITITGNVAVAGTMTLNGEPVATV